MIRRNVPLGESPEKWLLISQVEHARVSGELAAAWGGEVASIICNANSIDLHLQEVRREMLAAILHHDDGWTAWEADPGIDAEHERPYSFTELPPTDALRMWRDSVLRARQIGPIAGWSVAGHFEHLLRESHHAKLEVSQQWLDEIGEWRTAWLAEWRSINRPVHTQSLADECLGWLRTFDWLSLWLCCLCPASPGDEQCEAMTLAEGPLANSPVRFEPRPSSSADFTWHVSVTPWCFDVPFMEVDALGYAVPAKAYATTGELAKNRSPMRLRWKLLPQSEA